jgi:hypothetical protein
MATELNPHLLMPGPCGLCSATLFTPGYGPDLCPDCANAYSVFWTRAEVDTDEARYREALKEMAELIRRYPAGPREANGYRYRIRQIFTCNLDGQPIPESLRHPLSDAAVRALDKGVNLFVALAAQSATAARGANATPDGRLGVPGARARFDDAQKAKVVRGGEPKKAGTEN